MTDSKCIFIAYPAGFLCYEKIKRKIDYYTSNSSEFELVCFDDSNGFVEKYAGDRGCGWGVLTTYLECIERSTHAVLFEDRECYAEIRSILVSSRKPCRVVPLNLTHVVNKDRGEPYDVYVGRGTIWGNPYQIGVDGDRDEVIRRFAYDFQRGFLKASEDFEKNISKLKGKVIACHCKPAACHGDVIAAYINALDDGK